MPQCIAPLLRLHLFPCCELFSRSTQRNFLEQGYLRLLAQYFRFVHGDKERGVTHPEMIEARLKPVMGEVAIGEACTGNRQGGLVVGAVVVAKADFGIAGGANPNSHMNLWQAGKVEFEN